MSGRGGLALPHSNPVRSLSPARSVSTAFETRCPNGKKVIQYKKAKVEKWSPYLNSNGLVCRLSTYEDLECKGARQALGSRKAGAPNMLCDLGHVTDALGVSVGPAGLCVAGKGGMEAGAAGVATPSMDRPRRYQDFGGKGVVPEPGGHVGAEAHKQGHRPEHRLLQTRPPPGSAW